MMRAKRERTSLGGKGVAVATIRLGLYDADPSRGKITFVGKRYRDTPSNRELLQDAIACYNRIAEASPEVDMCIGVFSAG
jgi:hypothetical protein